MANEKHSINFLAYERDFSLAMYSNNVSTGKDWDEEERASSEEDISEKEMQTRGKDSSSSKTATQSYNLMPEYVVEVVDTRNHDIVLTRKERDVPFDDPPLSRYSEKRPLNITTSSNSFRLRKSGLRGKADMISAISPLL